MIQPIAKADGDHLPDGRREAHLDPVAIRASITKAFHEARLRHKLLGQPIVEWRDGQVVLVPAEEIEIVEPSHASETSNP